MKMRNMFPMGNRYDSNAGSLGSDGAASADPEQTRIVAPFRQSGMNDAHQQPFQREVGLVGMERGYPLETPRNPMVENLARRSPGPKNS